MSNFFHRIGNSLDDFMTKYRAMYAAATTPSTSANWNPVNDNRNTKIGSSFSKTTARIDQLIDDFPYLSNVQAVMTSYIVGDGITFNSRVVDESTGKVTLTQKRQRQQIEDAIAWASEQIDIAYVPGASSGSLEGWEMERLAQDRRVATGESCFIIHQDSTPGRYVPYALQPISTTHLTDFDAKVKNGNEIHRGLEYERATGKIVAFHFDSGVVDPTGLDSYSLGGTFRVPSEYVIFDKLTKSPGQLRGISPLAAAVLVAHDFEDVFNSEIDAAKMTAKFLGTVETDDIAGWMKRQAVALNSGGSKYQQEAQNAIMQFVKRGEKIDYTAQARPNNLLLPFTQIILRMIAASSNFSYEAISADFTGMNYTVTRASRAHQQKMIRPKVKHHITHTKTPIVRGIIQSAVLSGRIDLPGYFLNPRHYERGIFQIPGLEPVDPFRQAKADTENLANLIMSPQEICSRRGVEFTDVMEQYQEAKSIIEENGFDPEVFMQNLTDSSSTSTQSNGNADARSIEEELFMVDGDFYEMGEDGFEKVEDAS